MAVQQRTDDAPVQYSGERLVVRLGAPGGNQVIALLEAPDPQALLVGWTTSEADVLRGVSLLDTLGRHR
jgi:hypothetical protein